MKRIYTETFFPWMNDILTKSLARYRKKVLLLTRGRVLELGFGSGLSVPDYPHAVSEVIGLEPNPGMLRNARHRLGAVAKVVQGVGEQMPFANESFDGVSSFLTLCSVSDLEKTLSEIKRVLKPDGKFVFIEHCAQARGSLTRKFQRLVQPVWGRVAGGCHVTRDTLECIERAGFRIEALKTIGYSGFPNILSPMVRGVAAIR